MFGMDDVGGTSASSSGAGAGAGAGAAAGAGAGAGAGGASPVMAGAGAGGMMSMLGDLDFGGAQAVSETLIKRESGGGVQVEACYLRGASIKGPRFVQVRLTITNATSHDLTDFKVASTSLSAAQDVAEFAVVPTIAPGATITADLHVDFDGRCPLRFELAANEWRGKAKLNPPAGELLQAVVKTEAEFDALVSRLGGMQENSGSATLSEAVSSIGVPSLVLAAANVSQVSTTDCALQ